MLMQDQVICLRATNYSETSQVVVLLCRDLGKLTVMAKGSRRPRNAFDGPIELFSYGAASLSPGRGEAMGTLAEFQQRPVFRGLRLNLGALNAAMLAAELTDKFTEMHDPHPALFDALERFLGDVQQTEGTREILIHLIVYQLTLLAQAGIRPVFDRCVNGPNRFDPRWKAIYFSSRSNGFVCPDCEGAFVEKKRLSPAAAGALADPRRLRDLPEATVREIENLLLYHFTELLGRPPKCALHV